ncbi:PepSY-like domain-containing protein [Fulvivirga ligni]|uniref:PepSY-like domain-containing protein n=1 Tax=Fulvivirga ligni TaxID=2904246 RepID=UPI001F247BC3|nr:PepSY-like domain-containing protein [Fulvivirga ligni]UII24181.1 PepSY-like domain-containing protein [Fulvivirga ligni]
MKLRNILITGTFCFLMVNLSMAQTSTINEKQNSRMKTTINTRYNGVDFNNIKWQSTTDGYYEGSFNYQGRELTTQFDENGNWMQTSEPMNMTTVPTNLKNNLGEYESSSISGIHKIETNNETYYDVNVDGQDPMRFDKSGNLIKNP